MNPKRVLDLLGRLAMLKYFPAKDENVLEGLLDLVSEMCRNESEVEWLIKRMTSGLYAEWPGPQEMRACFCSRFPPRDGINAYSTVYPDGLPPSKEAALKQISGPELKALPPGHAASADVGLEAAVMILSKTNGVVNALGGPATPEEIANAPHWLRKCEGLE